MSETHCTWRLGRTVFHLVRGDLFAAPVEAIVNSEQTDFRLDGSAFTVSGQIARRFGDAVQPDLDRQTGGRSLPVGTVLVTGGGSYRAIFHAGFHHPSVFLGMSPDDNGTEHLRVIRGCVRQVLDRASEMGLRSVAFPLIGTGVFGLSPALLGFEFFEELAHVALAPGEGERPEVWLVVYDAGHLPMVLQAGVQAWLGLLPARPGWQPFRLGVPYLDRFEEQVVRCGDPQWAAWLLVRYAELLAGYLLSLLASAATPARRPPDVLPEDRPVTFGALRREGLRLAEDVTLPEHVSPWVHLAAAVLREERSAQRLERVNHDRNDIAHGRSFRPASEIVAELASFVQLEEWRRLLHEHGSPPLATLGPWVSLEPGGSGTGVLESWSRKAWTYVVPDTGARFAVSAGSGGG
jgi:O-acetyl-ADP-ribose deacetylase (regulator of RNase III)